MKATLVALLLLVQMLPPTKAVPMMCVGAQLAVVHAAALKLQGERATPPGEWCQRPASQMPAKAHACGCHKTDCTDSDPEHLPAHTDAMCLNFCTIAQCRCPMHDCP